MTTEGVVLRGTLRPDGTLELAEPVGLPPGPVEVTVKPAPAAAPARAPAGDWWQVLQQIRADREARGYPFLSDEEVAAHIEELRADDDRLDDLGRSRDDDRRE